MNSLQSSLYTAALALCLFSAGIFSGRKNRTSSPFAYFTAFLVIESLGFVFELLMAHPAAPLKGLWLGLRMASSLFVAPCLWLAIREIVEGARPKLSSLHHAHLWLIGAGIALTFPLLETAHWGTTYSDPAHPVTGLHSRVIHGTMLLCIAIFAWQGPFYLWRCRRLLLQQLHRQNPAGATFCATSSSTWLHLPLLLVFTTWILGLLRTVHCASHAPQEFAVLFSFIDVCVTVGAIYLTVKRASSMELRTVLIAPPLLVQARVILTETETPTIALAAPLPAFVSTETSAVKLPSASTENEIATTIPSVAKPTDPVAAKARDEAKYSRCNLPPRVRQRIKLKLKTALTKEALYRDSLLNLRSLSAAIKENTHYVSQVINQDLDSSFYQLVSRYRIEEAKKRLASFPDQTVIEIALFVGFNSKSTFNSAFRQNTGTTPREYRAKHFKEGRKGVK